MTDRATAHVIADDAEALLGADFRHPAIVEATDLFARADGVVVGTPVYKASYSGVLKALLDLLPQYALTGKTVLPLATGGSTAHVLAIDYALRPVLNSMGAAHIVQGWFTLDKDITALAPGIPWLWDTQPMLQSANVNGVVNQANAAWDLTFTSIK